MCSSDPGGGGESEGGGPKDSPNAANARCQENTNGDPPASAWQTGPIRAYVLHTYVPYIHVLLRVFYSRSLVRRLVPVLELLFVVLGDDLRE